MLYPPHPFHVYLRVFNVRRIYVHKVSPAAPVCLLAEHVSAVRPLCYGAGLAPMASAAAFSSSPPRTSSGRSDRDMCGAGDCAPVTSCSLPSSSCACPITEVVLPVSGLCGSLPSSGRPMVGGDARTMRRTSLEATALFTNAEGGCEGGVRSGGLVPRVALPSSEGVSSPGHRSGLSATASAAEDDDETRVEGNGPESPDDINIHEENLVDEEDNGTNGLGAGHGMGTNVHDVVVGAVLDVPAAGAHVRGKGKEQVVDGGDGRAVGKQTKTRKERREKIEERQKLEEERQRREEELHRQLKSELDRQGEIRDARLMTAMTTQLKTLHDKLLGQMGELRSKMQIRDNQCEDIGKLRSEVVDLEKELAKEDSPEKEKEELRWRLAQLRKLKEDKELARTKKKVMEQEIEWEMEQTRMETEQTRMEMEQTRVEMDHEEDRFAPSSSARPPQPQKRVRQPNLGIRIEEPSTPRTPRTRSQAKKNPVVDYETLLAGWKEITTDGSKMNVVDYCMSMKSFLRTRTMAELKCLCDEEQIDYETREKTIKGLIASRMQQTILRTSNSHDNDEDEVTPERDPDIMDAWHVGINLRKKHTVKVPYDDRVERKKIGDVARLKIGDLGMSETNTAIVRRHVHVVWMKKQTIGDLLHNQRDYARSYGSTCNCVESPFPCVEGHVQYSLSDLDAPDFLLTARNIAAQRTKQVRRGIIPALLDGLGELFSSAGKNLNVSIDDVRQCVSKEDTSQEDWNHEALVWRKKLRGLVCMPMDRNPGATYIVCPMVYTRACVTHSGTGIASWRVT
ncbi:hypothetical protein CBR_g66689 [Chara braunii]|uniref:Uncharacterized protein n=1 Tax=Chara braunii TaxID=69332 RepID=A0A388JQ97_CHABU|nr:hypothetical protein CBR_g66689 [Chara braunii]|eukprot:GBG59882.1 hypothetical protein CBR_g66689 [Chara braunii]